MIEAMKKVLETLERSVATCFDQYSHQQVMSQPDHFINQAITSLRQAIAEAEKQEQGEPATLEEIRKAMIFGIPLYTTPQQRKPVKFPTMLRKMWSGGEVQAWLDENVNEE